MAREFLQPRDQVLVEAPPPAPSQASSDRWSTGFLKDLDPNLGLVTRCPLPPISFTPDSNRQFYRGGQIPQTRILSNATQLSVSQSSGGGGTTINNVSVNSNSSTTNVTSSLPTALTASLTTPSLDPTNQYFTTISMAHTFTLIQANASSLARIRIYSTQNAQTIDAGRGDVPPTSETQHGVIADLFLDSPSSLMWNLSPAAQGSNLDSPQTSAQWITIDNIGPATTTVTISLLYVPEES